MTGRQSSAQNVVSGIGIKICIDISKIFPSTQRQSRNHVRQHWHLRPDIFQSIVAHQIVTPEKFWDQKIIFSRRILIYNWYRDRTILREIITWIHYSELATRSVGAGHPNYSSRTPSS